MAKMLEMMVRDNVLAVWNLTHIHNPLGCASQTGRHTGRLTLHVSTRIRYLMQSIVILGLGLVVLSVRIP